jgi:hypothetical protein
MKYTGRMKMTVLPIAKRTRLQPRDADRQGRHCGPVIVRRGGTVFGVRIPIRGLSLAQSWATPCNLCLVRLGYSRAGRCYETRGHVILISK